MRTTLDIDDDVLAAAKDLAKAEGKTVGTVISELARRALATPSHGYGPGLAESAAAYSLSDWPTFPRRGGPPVTSEMIERIQDEIDLEDATPWDHAADKPL
jgi:hypothetical protein